MPIFATQSRQLRLTWGVLVGIFDIVGTIASGYLTDRYDPRCLLVGYYFFRGVGLAILPLLLDESVHPPMLLFIVIYGLDWVATGEYTLAWIVAAALGVLAAGISWGIGRPQRALKAA